MTELKEQTNTGTYVHQNLIEDGGESLHEVQQIEDLPRSIFILLLRAQAQLPAIQWP